MGTLQGRAFVVTGATGRQGSAVARHLLGAGARVKGLTRTPQSAKAKALAGLGVEVVGGDLESVGSLRAAFAGAAGVYSVQNPYTSSFEAEIRQGRNVADAAKAEGVAHVVQGSAGIGEKTGIASWDSKLQIEEYMRSKGLALTVLRPMAFMELMTDKQFFPNASTFHVMPSLMGADKPVQWLATDDLGAIAARVFADPERYVGQDLKLLSDVQSINQVRATYVEVTGRKPPHFPMPLFLFRLFTGDDMINMWSWLRTATLDVSAETTRAILPEAKTVKSWLAAYR